MVATINPVAIQDGIYTVHGPRGRRTFRVRHQEADARFMPGRQLIAVLTGADNENDYTTVGWLRPDGSAVMFRKHRGTDFHRIVDAFRGIYLRNPLGEQMLGAGYELLESRRCFRCFRPLTTPESIDRGYGPECWSKISGGL